MYQVTPCFDQCYMNNNAFYPDQYNLSPYIYQSQYYNPYLNNQNPSINIFIAIPQNGQLRTPMLYSSQQNQYFLNAPQLTTQSYQNTAYPQPNLSYPFGFPGVPPTESKTKVKKNNKKKSHKHKSEKKKSHKKHKENSKKSKKAPTPQLPKIEPYCTFAATGSHGIFQRFYHCRTCGITGGDVVCEICANHCHKGHNLEFIDVQHGYCDCSSYGNCQRMPTSEDTRCVCEILGGKPSPFPLYQCNDCSIEDDSYICQNCAIKYHHGHDLVFCFGVSDKMCHNISWN